MTIVEINITRSHIQHPQFYPNRRVAIQDSSRLRTRFTIERIRGKFYLKDDWGYVFCKDRRWRWWGPMKSYLDNQVAL